MYYEFQVYLLIIFVPGHCSNYCRYIARSLSQQEDDTEPIDEGPKSFEPRLLGVMPDSDDKVFSIYDIQVC
jgi:hypothetical protein